MEEIYFIACLDPKTSYVEVGWPASQALGIITPRNATKTCSQFYLMWKAAHAFVKTLGREYMVDGVKVSHRRFVASDEP